MPREISPMKPFRAAKRAAAKKRKNQKPPKRKCLDCQKLGYTVRLHECEKQICRKLPPSITPEAAKNIDTNYSPCDVIIFYLKEVEQKSWEEVSAKIGSAMGVDIPADICEQRYQSVYAKNIQVAAYIYGRSSHAPPPGRLLSIPEHQLCSFDGRCLLESRRAHKKLDWKIFHQEFFGQYKKKSVVSWYELLNKKFPEWPPVLSENKPLEEPTGIKNEL